MSRVTPFGYDANMATHDSTEAEVFQQFLAIQVASAGRTKSPEELVRLWCSREQEQRDTLGAIEEGIADMEAGRVHPFTAVNDEIRRKHGWVSNGVYKMSRDYRKRYGSGKSRKPQGRSVFHDAEEA